MRQRYSDSRSAGRSESVPYIPGEPKGDRHERRLRAGLDVEQELSAWCRERGVALEIKNEGHHWRFTHGKKALDWWPSSAKMVFGGQWKRGLHVHDAGQARKQVKRFFGLK